MFEIHLIVINFLKKKTCMSKTLLSLLLLIMFLPLKMAAHPASISPAIPDTSVANEPAGNFNALKIPVAKKKKMNFFQKIMYKMVLKKINKTMSRIKEEEVDADKLARQAKTWGLLSLAAILIFPILAIPFGIMAITKGSAALENGTSIPAEARSGRTMGIISLSILLAFLFLIIIIVAGFSFT